MTAAQEFGGVPIQFHHKSTNGIGHPVRATSRRAVGPRPHADTASQHDVHGRLLNGDMMTDLKRPGLGKRLASAVELRGWVGAGRFLASRIGLRNPLNLLRHFPIGHVVRYWLAQVLGSILQSLGRQAVAPSLSVFAAAAESITSEPSKFVGELLNDVPAEDLKRYRTEFLDVTVELQRRYSEVSLRFPVRWQTERQTSEALYLLVRALKPRTIVETGVANGHSSYVFLRALRENGTGCLASVDVEDDVGALVDEDLRTPWVPVTISAANPIADLRSCLEGQLGDEVDLYFHDADHRYLPHLAELRIGYEALSRGGILLSDDADTTPAYLDFTRQIGVSSALLIDGRKICAGFRKI